MELQTVFLTPPVSSHDHCPWSWLLSLTMASVPDHGYCLLLCLLSVLGYCPWPQDLSLVTSTIPHDCCPGVLATIPSHGRLSWPWPFSLAAVTGHDWCPWLRPLPLIRLLPWPWSLCLTVAIVLRPWLPSLTNVPSNDRWPTMATILGHYSCPWSRPLSLTMTTISDHSSCLLLERCPWPWPMYLTVATVLWLGCCSWPLFILWMLCPNVSAFPGHNCFPYPLLLSLTMAVRCPVARLPSLTCPLNWPLSLTIAAVQGHYGARGGPSHGWYPLLWFLPLRCHCPGPNCCPWSWPLSPAMIAVHDFGHCPCIWPWLLYLTMVISS